MLFGRRVSQNSGTPKVLMDNNDLLLYEQGSTLGTRVRVLIFQKRVHIYKMDGSGVYGSFPVSELTLSELGDTSYLYLDLLSSKHLQFPASSPLRGLVNKAVNQRSLSLIQKLFKQNFFILFAVFVAVVIVAYVLIVNLVPVVGLRLIHTQQEIELGENIKQSMLAEEKLAGNRVDKQGSLALQEFADKMTLSDRFPIKVTMVNSDIINAYALPGGNIIVYRGIVRKIKSPDELAALLAHESSHVNQRHTLKSLLRSTANGLILSIIFGDASGLSGAVAEQAETLNGLQYSRSLETDADEKGMELLAENKIDVRGMRKLMQQLQEEETVPAGYSFFSTHPMTKERIKAAEAFAAGHPQTYERRFDLETMFYRIKSEVTE